MLYAMIDIVYRQRLVYVICND